jgi:hypothetical protein
MMSRGLTKQQSQTLLMNWYIDYVLAHLTDISETEKKLLHKILTP